MVNDVVKNFLIKFKVDDRELKRATDSNNVLKQLGGGNPQGFIRNVDKLQRDLRQVFTKDMPKAFTDLGKVADKLREQQFNRMKNDLERLGRVLEQRMARLDQATTPDQRAFATRKLNRTVDLMSNISGRAAGMGGGGGGMAGMAAGAGNFLFGVSAALGGINEFRNANLQNLTISKSPFIQRRQQFFEGNYEDAVMQALERGDTRAREFAKTSRQLRSAQMGALGAGGILAAAGSGAAVGMGVGGPIGAMIGAGVGLSLIHI